MTKAQIELQELFQQMMHGVISYSIMLLDTDGTILTWNKGAETIHGYTPEEIIGQHISLFYLPQDRQTDLPKRLLETARQEGAAKNAGRRIRKNGQMFWGSIEITAIKSAGGEVIGFTNLARELKDETDIGHFWFDDSGILHTKASATRHTAEKIKEFRTALADASGKDRLCCVADIRDAILVDAGNSFASAEMYQYPRRGVHIVII